MYYINGIRYEGEFKNDRLDGNDILFYTNSDIFEKEWKIDIKNGKGILYYDNGDRVIGYYSGGEKIGKHVFIKKNDKI